MISLALANRLGAVSKLGGGLTYLANKITAAGGTFSAFVPTELAKLYGDSTGSTPATVDGLIGRANDWSPLGPELVTNGDFSAGTTGWALVGTGGSWEVASGEAVLTGSGGSSPSIRETINTVVGRSYQLTFSGRRGTATTNLRGYGVGGVTVDISATTNTTASLIFTATATTSNIDIGVVSAGVGTVYIDNISVREVGVSYGPELVTNGGFDSATDWTLTQPTSGVVSITGGVMRVNSIDGSFAASYNSQAPIVSGKTYKIDFDVLAYSGTAGIQFTGAGAVAIPAGTGRKSITTVADGNDIGFKRTAACDITIDNLSVREVFSGIHATQATTGNKPVLRRGIVNLLTQSENFADAAWTKNASVANNGNGSYTLTAGAGTYQGLLRQSKAVVGVPNSVVFRVKKGNHRYVGIRLGQYIVDGDEKVPFYDFDTDTISNVVAGVTLSRVLIGGGVVDLILVAASPTLTTADLWLTSNTGSTGAAKSGTETLVIYRAQLVQGLAVGDYIPTTTAPASSPSGPMYAQFDGTTDYLSLSAVPFQMSDDHWVVACARSDDTASRAPFGVAGAGTQRCGVLYSTGGFWRLRYVDDAAVAQELVCTTATPAGSVRVVSGRKIGNTKVVRLNGVQEASNATAIGATTLTQANIGAITSASAQMLGNIYAVFYGKGTISDDTLLAVEKLAANFGGFSL